MCDAGLPAESQRAIVEAARSYERLRLEEASTQLWLASCTGATPLSGVYRVRDLYRRDWAALAESWGFHRPVTWWEWRDGVWLVDHVSRLTGVAWLHPGPLAENHWVLHAQQRPHAGLRLPSRQIFEGILQQARALGAVRVYAGLGSERPGWQRWLARRGFTGRDAVGPYVDLPPAAFPGRLAELVQVGGGADGR